MNEPAYWAIWLSADDARHANVLRLTGVEVCAVQDGVWLRGDRSDEALQDRLCLLPGAHRFAVLPDGQLQAVGTIAPKGHLPEGPWQPIARWSPLAVPAIGRPASTPARLVLRMVRDFEPLEPSLLITTWDAWSAYAATAPQVRLECLAFALADDGRVLLRGSPLPPLRGERWVERGGITTPAGWTWSPGVEPLVLSSLLDLDSDDLALLHTDGSWERLAASDFVRATRSAVRNTAEQCEHAG
jgi:hypothetical protein